MLKNELKCYMIDWCERDAKEIHEKNKVSGGRYL